MAEQQQNKERANLSRELKACPPPLPPPFTRFFAPLLQVKNLRFIRNRKYIFQIMESDIFINLLHVIVERVNKRSRFASDGLFYRTLFLLGMSLNEQKRAHTEGKEFKFLQKSNASGIFETLERMMNRPEVETHVDLLWWIIKVFLPSTFHYSF